MNYKQILLLAADSTDKLRATDVDRVLGEAHKQNCLKGFIEYLLKHPLKRETRELLLKKDI